MRTAERLDPHLVILVLTTIVVGAALGLARPDVFLGMQNIQSMLLQTSVIGLLSLAVAITMLTGGIDLSVNATANLSSILTAGFLMTAATEGGLIPPNLAMLPAIAVGLAVGALCGLFNGVLIAWLRFPPILATLGTMTLFTGIGTVVTGGSTFFGVSTLTAIGRGTLIGLPIPALVFLLAALVLSLVLQGRRFGFNLYLFGANESAARYSGINARRLILGVYTISGALSGLAGLINLGVTNSANVDFGSSYVLLAILIAVLGGISPLGGSGRLVGVVFAVIILQLLSTGLNLIFQSSGSNFLKDFAWGVTLIVVLALGRTRLPALARMLGGGARRGGG